MFRVFGHENVWVLDGGLPKWRASGYDVESSATSDAILKANAASEVVEKIYKGQSVSLFIHINAFCQCKLQFQSVYCYLWFIHIFAACAD